MSFLSNNNSEFLSARITQRGRNSVAQGNFVISYFQIGDSEFDYTDPFTNLNGLQSNPHQSVFAPFDKDSGVKYPYLIDSTSGSTTYGVPIQVSTTETLRNVMGPAGFVSNYESYDSVECTGTTIECETQMVSLSSVNGTDTLTVLTGASFNNCEYIALVFGTFNALDPLHPVITGNSNSFIYRVTQVQGNDLILDRPMPDLSSCTGNAQVVCLNCENEFPVDVEFNPNCRPVEIDPQQQLNSWTLNVVWDKKPVGFDVNGIDENLTGFTSNKHVSTKQFLGYTTSSGQTIVDGSDVEVDYPTSYLNSFDEQILVTPEEQRTIAIIHFSELGDLKNDPERFFKYDDYISTNNVVLDALLEDDNGDEVTDLEYFEVYIPFINYHRSTGTTVGALFTMGDTDYFIKSSINNRLSVKFRYLLDENGYNVGRVMVDNKVVIFDDQELVAMLDYKSNRRHTLPAPNVNLVPTDDSIATTFFSGSTAQTVWVTYSFDYSGDSQLNGLPCNYYSKIEVSADDPCFENPSHLKIKFSGDGFQHMYTSLCDATQGYIADGFKVLVQITDNGELPSHDLWKEVDCTSLIPNHNVGDLIDPVNMVDYSFTITKGLYDNATVYDLEDYLGAIPNEPSTEPQFGDEQPFPGSIRLVRATDIERMNFLVNLPESQFNTTQNPTYTDGDTKRISEIALLNENKEVLVVAKAANPVKRLGTQVFAVKLDF